MGHLIFGLFLPCVICYRFLARLVQHLFLSSSRGRSHKHVKPDFLLCIFGLLHAVFDLHMLRVFRYPCCIRTYFLWALEDVVSGATKFRSQI